MITIQWVCQWLVVLWMLFVFLVSVYGDFNDRPAKKANGMFGFCAGAVIIGLILCILKGAGAFSEIL